LTFLFSIGSGFVRNQWMHLRKGFLRVGLLVGVVLLTQALAGGADSWQVGVPIVTYWAGPPLTDRVAEQMAQGEWNLVWCNESELDVAARHGLRAQLQDGLLSPESLDEEGKRAKLNALIGRVRNHPALYSYFITDEPNTTNFAGLGRLLAYLRDRDPAHLSYINLFPTYASNAQLGNSGEKVAAYQAHLEQYLRKVRPALLSYDHYQFTAKGDSPDYFLNLALIRRAALESGLPFLNIVQAASWTPSMRVPNADEMSFLVYTTLAYGAQGISYYVYCCAGHVGGIANPDGTPTAVYPALQRLNHDFVMIARELQPLRSIGVYHAGMVPPGGERLPDKAAFRIDPPIKHADFKPPEPLRGVLIGLFDRPGKSSKPTYALVVNLDYTHEQAVGLRGAGRLESLEPRTREWIPSPQKRLEVTLPPGGGRLLRVLR
jgi:hypothetical protein